MGSGLIDIEIPPAPAVDAIPITVLLSLAIAAALLLAVMYQRRRQTPRRQARRRLDMLERSSRHADRNEKCVVYRLARIVSVGVGEAALTSHTPLPDSLAAHRQRWADFIARLERNRYHPAPVAREDLDALFDEARFWLARWPQ